MFLKYRNVNINRFVVIHEVLKRKQKKKIIVT